MVGNIYIYACFTSNTVVIECLLTLCPSPIPGHMSKCPCLTPTPWRLMGLPVHKEDSLRGLIKYYLLLEIISLVMIATLCVTLTKDG